MRKLAVIAALGLALAACGGDKGPSGSPTGSPSPSPSARLSTTGKLTLISPKPGAVVDGPSVTVKVKVTGATVVTAQNATVAPDVGHIHVELDGETLSVLAGETYTIDEVKPGRHTLIVRFVAGDHAPFYPQVVEQIVFTVR